jgi:hypothetical protein
MQNKKARKAAAQVNRFLNPALIDNDGERKLGKGIPKTKRDFHTILRHLDSQLRKADPTLPREISAAHYLTVHKLFELALRDNSASVLQQCPKCHEKIEVMVNDARCEKNSVEALKTMAERMFPKLAQLTHEVNIAGQINMVSEHIGAIIVKYVPADKRVNCLCEIEQLIEKSKNVTEQQVQSDISELPIAVAG